MLSIGPSFRGRWQYLLNRDLSSPLWIRPLLSADILRTTKMPITSISHDAAAFRKRCEHKINLERRGIIRSFANLEAESKTPLRRRRRQKGEADADTKSNTNYPSPQSGLAFGSAEGAFAPVDPDTGKLLSAPEYLSLASLSPWVPCPELVIKRVFEIAEASDSDIHTDLGCGDGRLNFAAISLPWNVKSSWGIDVDPNILERCKARQRKRFVPNSHIIDTEQERLSSLSNVAPESERLEFVQADLIRAIERQRQIYSKERQSESLNQSCQNLKDTIIASSEEEDWSNEDEVNRRLSKSTIVTMYFVDNALEQLRPYLASLLGGKENIRVITIGYEMKGWEPDWAERILGLTVFKYDMKNISPDKIDWRDAKVKAGNVDGLNENKASEDECFQDVMATPGDIPRRHSDRSDDHDENKSFSNYLRKKEEMEELTKGLRIHHDEQLDDFAAFRSKRKAMEENSLISDFEQWKSMDEDWDFDEDEDPYELGNEANWTMQGTKVNGGRDRGALAEPGMEKGSLDKIRNSSHIHGKKRPVWKKP